MALFAFFSRLVRRARTALDLDRPVAVERARLAAHAAWLDATAGNLRLSVIRGLASMPRAEMRLRVALARELEAAAAALVGG